MKYLPVSEQHSGSRLSWEQSHSVTASERSGIPRPQRLERSGIPRPQRLERSGIPRPQRLDELHLHFLSLFYFRNITP